MKNNLNTELIIFDFDGTIANSLPLLVSVFRNIASEHQHRHLSEILELTPEGHPVLDMPAIQHLRSHGIASLVSHFKLTKPQAALLYLRMQSKLTRRWSELELIPGIHPVVEQLSAKYNLGIVTSNRESVVKKFINHHHLPDFSPIKSSRYLYGKHRVINRIIKPRLGAPALKAIYVGDEIRDIQAAKRSGIPSIAVTWGLSSRELLLSHHPTQIVDLPSQLPLAIKDILSTPNQSQPLVSSS